MVLQLIFGMTMSQVLKYLQFAHQIINKKLKKDLLAKIKLLSYEKLEECQEMISKRHPSLQNVQGTMDGLKIQVQELTVGVFQSHFYNGWQSNHYVTSILCFTTNRTVPAAFYKVSGCTHDSTVTKHESIYSKLEKI